MAEDTKKKGKVERVMVHCRIRPLSEEDVKSYGRDSVMESIEQSKGLIVLKKDYDKKTFVFDSVFDSSSTQKEIYAKVADPVVSSVLQGYNGTIFAYGQTGTGKTFTMIGSSGENKGIIPRSMQQIFTFIQASQTHSFQVKIGFLQLYMEMLQDLLHPDESKPIRIREDPDEGVYLTGVNWVNVNRVKDCMELLSIGDRNRSTAFTSMNAHSSRSHAVYMVKIEKRVKYTPDQLEELEKKGEMPDQSMTKSTLYLVDLAGSERVKKSRASGNRLDEAKNINLALLALGNCIQALSDKKAKYVPFRDSKLTRLLEDSLGGNSKTSLIVTVGPSAGHAQETLSALQFGLRAMKIENRPELNIKVDYRALCAQLQSELDKINDGSNMFNIEKEQYLEEINSLKAQIEKLLAEREQMESLLEEYRKGHNDLTQFEDRKKSEMLKIQNSYKLKLEKKEAEHKKFLDEIDKLMLEQEKESKAKQHQIVELKNQNKHLNNEVKQVHEELEQEKADRELRATQLISELEDLKQKLQTEKQKGQELQQENEKLIKSTQEKENIIQEITETSEYTKASHTQEVETLAKEIQKHQNSLEKSKQQLIQKSNEWKEKYEKLEKTLQQKFLVKEKEMMLKIEDLEKKCNSVEFSVTQLQRENNGLKDELNAEKNNLSLNIQKNEKIKENYESKIFELTSEIAKLDKKIKETELNYIKSNEELLDQQKINEDKMNKIFEDLKQTKAKNSKLIKACKDLENTIKDLEEKNNQKTEEIANLIKTFESDKAGLSAEINALGVENNDINKDRTKLIKKVENLSKKLSQIAKQKEKLYTETETKQQEFNTLIEQREQLEADLEQTKGQIKELAETIQSLQSQNSQQKSEIKTLTAESNKKEIAIQAYQKTIQDLQNTIVNNESDLKDLREALRDLKESNESYGNTVNILGNDKAQISKELKVCKEALEKISKDFKNALDQHKALEAEKNESNLLYAQQKQQLTNKINKLTEEYKQLELNFFNITNELRKKISEIETAKESLIILTDSILKGFSNQKDKIFKICEVKTSLLSHIQLSLTTKISKLKQTIKEKSHKIEKLEISNKKELLLLSESHAKELQGLKLSNKDYIDALEDKFSQETQELQTYYEDIIRKSNSKNEKAQDELKAFYMAQIDHLNKTHAFSVEELKSSHARSLNEINQAHAQEISEIKEDNSRKIKEYETEIKKNNLKHAETVEIINKDWENKLEHLKSLHEESFNQMITFRQKEIEQLSKENTHLRLEFENSLDRQKNHSFVLKTHQQTLIEDVSKSYKQEIEALNIEHDTKIKRKDNEISDLKKKSKESNEKLESLKKELEILNEIYEKTKNDLKKIESDLKKTEHHRQQLEETQKLLTKKYEFEKNKNNELETNSNELIEKISTLQDENKKTSQKLNEIIKKSKKSEDETYKTYKMRVNDLEQELIQAQRKNSSLELEIQSEYVLQGILSQIELNQAYSLAKSLEGSLRASEESYEQLKHEYLLYKSSSHELTVDNYAYISYLVLDKAILTIENQKLVQDSLYRQRKLLEIDEAVTGNYDLISYLKDFIKNHKKGGNLFEFMSLFVNFYSKVSEKLPIDNNTMQVFYLSRLVHEKYLSLNKNTSSKLVKVKKLYERPLNDTEKELGLQFKNETQQEILIKKAKEAENNIKIAVESLIDQMITILDCQNASTSQIKHILDTRKCEAEPLLGYDQLKSLEISGIPKSLRARTSETSETIESLKNLCTHLSALLCMQSALYSCSLSRNYYLEWLAEDRSEIICTLLSSLKPRPALSTKSYLSTCKDLMENAALVIQRFYRKRKRRLTKKQAYIAEYKYQMFEEEKESLSNKLSQINSKTGLHLMKNHFKEVNIIFTSICKKFMKSQTDLTKF